MGLISPSKVQTTECSGRTQRKLPVPQRIDLGQGNLRMTSGTSSATMSGVSRPGFVIFATRKRPFLSSTSAQSSRRTFAERRKPSMACAGASTRGPLRSSVVSAVTPARPSTDSTSRRGPAWLWAPS
jgi:hypothetical protein